MENVDAELVVVLLLLIPKVLSVAPPNDDDCEPGIRLSFALLARRPLFVVRLNMCGIRARLREPADEPSGGCKD